MMARNDLPNWLLALILTVFWRVDRIRNALFPEVERRWPAVYVATWRRSRVVVVPKLCFIRTSKAPAVVANR